MTDTIKTLLASLTCLFVLLSCILREVDAAIILNSSFSISEDYNDNLFFTAANKESDFTTTLSPFLSIGYTSKNVSATIGYQGSAQFHADNPTEDEYFQSLSIDLDLPILNRQSRGVTVQVTEDVSYSPELPGVSFHSEDDPPGLRRPGNVREQQGTGVQLNRTDTFENRAGLLVSYDWTERFNLASSYTNVITRYSGSALEDREAHQTTFDAVYRYPYSQRTEWTGQYGTNYTTSNNEQDKLQHSLLLGVTRHMTELVTASGTAGVSFVEEESPQYTLTTGITKRTQTGSLSLQYSNTISTGLGIVRSVTRDETVRGHIIQNLNDKLSSYLDASYTSKESLSGNEIDATTIAGGAGLSARFLKWLEGRLSYSYLKQDTESGTSLGEDGERNVYMITLTAIAPTWKIFK